MKIIILFACLIIINTGISYSSEFKFTEGFFGDSIIFCSNAVNNKNLSFVKNGIKDEASVVDDNKIEKDNYLYSFPPFPQPATKEVRSLVYWDTSCDIEQDEIGIYNIYGVKVSNRDKISFDKLSVYNGYLIWNCSSMASGVYLIVIKHGNAAITIKVMVN